MKSWPVLTPLGKSICEHDHNSHNHCPLMITATLKGSFTSVVWNYYHCGSKKRGSAPSLGKKTRDKWCHMRINFNSLRDFYSFCMFLQGESVKYFQIFCTYAKRVGALMWIKIHCPNCLLFFTLKLLPHIGFHPRLNILMAEQNFLASLKYFRGGGG